MVKINEKKTKKAVRQANEEVVNEYIPEVKEEEKDHIGEANEMVEKLWKSNLENEGRSMFTKDEVIAILNSLLK